MVTRPTAALSCKRTVADKMADAPADESDDELTPLERRTLAAKVVQRVWRKRDAGSSWAQLLGSIPKLREAYMDADAVKAGASSNPLYSDLSLIHI